MPAPQAPADDHERKLLIDLTSAKIARLESALETNWIAHLILAGIGFALVLDIGNLPGLLSNYFIRGQYDKKGVAAIVLAVLLYYFMKLGHLLSSYAEASQLQRSLFKDLGEAKTLPIRKSTNFFAEAYSDESFAGKSFWPYLLVTTAAVTLAQAAALFLVVQAYGTNPWLPAIFLACGAVLIYAYTAFGKSRSRPLGAALGIVWIGALGEAGAMAFWGHGWAPAAQLASEAIMVTLYLLFWDSQKQRPQATLVVLFSVILAVLWLILFAFTAR